jgi:hypothetical protein
MFAVTPINGRFLGYYVHRKIPATDRDKVIQSLDPKYEFAPDLLALDEYGDEELGWVFAVRNGLEDMIFDIKAGMTLVVPPLDAIKRF